MDERRERTKLWLVWGLVAAVAMVQAGTWLGVAGPGVQLSVVLQTIASWVAILALAALASRRIGTLSERLTEREDAHRATLAEVEQLQIQNAMLQIVARSVDVPLTFQALAVRIARLVPCDRVGLAILRETGEEFETFTARVQEDERRARPRPDVIFALERTAIGAVVRSAEPMIVNDIQAVTGEYLDANVLYTSGFRSALVMPLVSNGRGVGTLNVVSRRDAAFTSEHVETLRPIAEILAVAHVAQRLHVLVGRYRTMEVMSEATLSVAAEINSALQTIIGHCALLERGYPDPGLQRDLATIVHQSQRIAELLDRMRASVHDRLREVTLTIEETKIPTSPDTYQRANEST